MTLEVRVLAIEFASVKGVSFRYRVSIWPGTVVNIIGVHRSAFHPKWEFKLTHYLRRAEHQVLNVLHLVITQARDA
jgi:hypothetical protein